MTGNSSVCQQVFALRYNALTFKIIVSYFAYIDEKFDLRKDCRFDSRVKQAHWDDGLHMWRVTSNGKRGVYKTAARHLIICTVR